MNLFLHSLLMIFGFSFDVCTCYFSSDSKLLKPQSKTEVEGGNSKGNESALAKVNPSLYKKLIIDDLTTTSMYLLFIVFNVCQIEI